MGVGDWQEYMARRLGKEWSIYEARRPYMQETFGTMTYQEQFLLDGHILAGWDVAYADKHLRKNRDIRNDTELKAKFLADTLANGHPEEDMEQVWSEIEEAVDSGYSFNKSHSVSYTMTTYHTAYLKYYYPEHFYASLMTSCKTDGDGQDEISGYIAECKSRDMTILPPDINLSGDSFVVTEKGINYRISTVKHVGESALEHIMELRPIASFQDFLDRRVKGKAKKNVVVNLVKAGAFDFDNPDRAELLHQFDMSELTKKQIKEGFVPEPYEYDDKIKMEWEFDVLGMYLSAHPLEKYGFRELDEYRDGEIAMQGGEIYDMRVFKDKNNNEMAFIHINTLFGNVKVLVFQAVWARKSVQEMMKPGNIVLVKGRRSGGDIMFNEGELLEEAEQIE